MLELLQRSQQLLPSVRYSLLNSWQGSLLHRRHRWPDPAAVIISPPVTSPAGVAPPCMHSLDMIPPCEKVQLLLANGRLLEWCLLALKRATHEAEAMMRGKIPRGARSMKESLNHRDQNGVGTLACSRFLLSLLGMLTATFSGTVYRYLYCTQYSILKIKIILSTRCVSVLPGKLLYIQQK